MENRIAIGRNTVAYVALTHPNFKFVKSNNATIQGLLSEGLCRADVVAKLGAAVATGVLSNDSSLVLSEILSDSVQYSPLVALRTKHPQSGHFIFEKEFPKFADYSTKDVLLFLNATFSFLRECRKTEAAGQQEIREISRQAEYFDNMIPLTPGESEEIRGSSVMMDRTNTAAAGTPSAPSVLPGGSDDGAPAGSTRSSNCFVCAEDVYLLGVTPW